MRPQPLADLIAIRFDEGPCRRFSLAEDIDEDNWELFRRRAGIPEAMEPEAALRNLNLLAADGRMTNAGAWLLAKDITKFSLIAESMCLLRYIEKMGTGTVDMIRRCAEAGLREPEFEAGEGFATRIWRPVRRATRFPSGRETTRETRGSVRETTPDYRDTTQEADRTTQEPDYTTQEREGSTDSGSPRDRIVALLRSDPTLTRTVLASRVGLTPEGVKYHLDKIRRAGRIRHVGPTKKGRWEVLDGEVGP